MKKIIAVLLVLVMMAGLTACVSDDLEIPSLDNKGAKLSAAEKEKKAEYYKTWAKSDDFGTEYPFMSIDLKFDEVRLVMEVTDTHMFLILGETEAGLYEKDGKVYVHIKAAGDDGAIGEQWMYATIPESGDSMLGSFDSDFSDGSGLGSVEYVDTVKEGGKTYDVLNITGGAILGSDESGHQYKAYVNAASHKLVRLEVDETMNASAQESKTATLKGTISFVEGSSFKVPSNAKEVSYDELSMSFGLTLMALMFSNPAVSGLFS